jgi:hypothetical protein
MKLVSLMFPFSFLISFLSSQAIALSPHTLLGQFIIQYKMLNKFLSPMENPSSLFTFIKAYLPSPWRDSTLALLFYARY